MSKDRYERRHRRTARHPESIAFMASADFDSVPSLAEAMGLEDESSTYEQFRKAVLANGWTLAELRCDVRPSEELLSLMDQIGLTNYERFVARLEREGWAR